MIIEIGRYIEAIASSEGCFATLGRLRPATGGEDGAREGEKGGGKPVLSMFGHESVDLGVVAGEEHLTLRCPLRWNDQAARRLRSLAERGRGLGGRFFTEWSLLEAEVTIFDTVGRALVVDVLARPTPRGETLKSFLERTLARGDTRALIDAARSFEEMVEWNDSTGRRGGIALRNILADPGGQLSLTALSAVDQTSRIREMLASWARFEEFVWDEASTVTTVCRDGRWELVDVTGRPLTEGSYDWIGECSEGFFLAQNGGRCGYLDSRGREAIPFVWDDAVSFVEGCAAVTRNGESFFIDPKGRRI